MNISQRDCCQKRSNGMQVTEQQRSVVQCAVPLQHTPPRCFMRKMSLSVKRLIIEQSSRIYS